MSDELDARIDDITAHPEPGVERPLDQLVWQFATQARACRTMGSELYTHLLVEAIGDLRSRGPCWRLVCDHVAPGRGNAIALRLMAAVHRLVLTDRAPELAPFFASVGGDGDPAAAWPVFRAVAEQHEEELVGLVALGCQTNETGRAASLALGFLHAVEHAGGLPVAMVEIGTAAGLNLRWDHFHYSGGGREWGDPTSPVDLAGFWVDPPDGADVEVDVASRVGVDRAPIDPTTEEGRLALASSVWGDQAARFARLAGAIEIARRVPAEIVTADAVTWVEENLDVADGRLTVLVQSVLREYLDDDHEARLDRAVAAAGARATDTAPLAWVELEPISLQRRHGLSATLWPSGRRHELTTAGSLGADVRRV